MIGVAARRLGVSRFDRALAKAERLASGITTEELSVRRLEARLVCPSCGQGHEDVARELKAARSRRDAGDLQLEQLRLQLWSRR
jgi:DNA repair exonuclease SbcCD ATPase subunit